MTEKVVRKQQGNGKLSVLPLFNDKLVIFYVNEFHLMRKV
jgi:hypothetical protein